MNKTHFKERKKLTQQLRQISVSKTNYLNLKKEGSAGDSFNDVITELLKKAAQQKPPSLEGGT